VRAEVEVEANNGLDEEISGAIAGMQMNSRTNS
jgi:hypothetical protein